MIFITGFLLISAAGIVANLPKIPDWLLTIAAFSLSVGIGLILLSIAIKAWEFMP